MSNKGIKMMKKFSILMVTASTLLSGCYLERDINYVRPEQPLVNIKTIHQTIEYKSKSRIKLTRDEVSNIKDKIAQAQKMQDIRIRIIGPHTVGTKSNLKTQSRINYIIQICTKLGVPKSSIQIVDKMNWSNEHIKWRPNMIIVEFEWYDREVNCPGWDQVMDGRVAPEGEENFGCTTKSNLAKMVADPKDLLEGKKLATPDAQHSTMGVEKYQTDKVKALKIEKIKEGMAN